ncbi:nuclear transport factor 2 family protein [Jidongwangia harbinensis]|uniref:nuclear transport factor 2 family protein n=1 Tax=Jidongwangia harbinensis TaxID=2878561 RepID=UPI001CD98D16|nr:nuclear transport factor 2 family protein [Jidongwangia harbinensis]MCA2218361.1 nuclear transport factor 2 family protein [Jidongwangia harbinensis]
MTDQSPFTATHFAPTADDTETLLAWFARYDDHVRRNDTAAMADMALFPLVVMTNDSAGECVTQEWDRETFLQAMGMGADPSTRIDNERRPVFLNSDLAVVVTDSTVTADGRTRYMRYVDVMAKTGGQWRFKSMIQAGWGDMLKEYLGA